MRSNYGAEIMVFLMPKCPGFFVHDRIVANSEVLWKAQGRVPWVEAVRHFAFLGVWHVPTCHIGLGIDISRNATQDLVFGLKVFTLHASVIHPDISRLVGARLIKRIAHQSLDLLRTAGIPDLRHELDEALSRVIISTKNIGKGYGHPTWKGQQARKAFEKSPNSPVLDTSYSEKGAVGMLDFCIMN